MLGYTKCDKKGNRRFSYAGWQVIDTNQHITLQELDVV